MIQRKVVYLTITDELLKVLPEIITKIKNQFDIYAEPNNIYESIKGINNIVPGLFIKGTRIPGCINDFKICVRAIIGQLVSVKLARTILKRIIEIFDDKIKYNEEDLYLFSAPEKFLNLNNEITNVLDSFNTMLILMFALIQLKK